MLKVTLVKSVIGSTPANRATVYALGLRKIGQSNTFEDTQSTRGMIHKVKHLLKVEEAEGEKVRRRQGKKVAASVTEEKPKKAAAKKAPAKSASSDDEKAAKPKAKAAPKKKKSEEEGQ